MARASGGQLERAAGVDVRVAVTHFEPARGDIILCEITDRKGNVLFILVKSCEHAPLPNPSP